MRSLIILEVEHGEDTDALLRYAEILGTPGLVNEVNTLNYTVRVDLPACFVLDSGESLGQAQHESHDLSRYED